MKELLRRREFLQLQRFELSLYNVVFALSIVVDVVSKLRGKPNAQRTMPEWEYVYFQSMLANKDVKIVLADRNGLGCECLAQEFFQVCFFCFPGPYSSTECRRQDNVAYGKSGCNYEE